MKYIVSDINVDSEKGSVCLRQRPFKTNPVQYCVSVVFLMNLISSISEADCLL